MEQLLPIIVGAVALIAGTLLGKILFAKNTKQLLETAEKQAQQIISAATTIWQFLFLGDQNRKE